MNQPLENWLRSTLERRHPEWGVAEIRPAGAGLEFFVFRADSSALGPLAIKVPRVRWISNANDARLDARDLLRQETVIASHLRKYGIPVPEVYDLCLDDTDVLVSQFVAGDGGPPRPRAFGQLIRRIHEASPPEMRPVAQVRDTVEVTVAGLITERARAIESLADVTLLLPAAVQMCEVIGRVGGDKRLLHLDARHDNILARQGDILAIIDWSNALIGPPALELARIAEYGHLDRDFLDGYGVANVFEKIPTAAEVVFRLYTATMLALVFLSEAPNAERAGPAVSRVEALVRQLSAELP